MPDVNLFHEEDGGECTVENGAPELSNGFASAGYLSLFGGNEDDSGLTGDDAKQWWGNLDEPVEARRYRSETQYLMRSLPLVPANLRRVEDAAGRDLGWMVAEFGASITALATIPARNRMRLKVDILINGELTSFTYDEIRK